MMELETEAGWDRFLPSPHLPLIIILNFTPRFITRVKQGL